MTGFFKALDSVKSAEGKENPNPLAHAGHGQEASLSLRAVPLLELAQIGQIQLVSEEVKWVALRVLEWAVLWPLQGRLIESSLSKTRPQTARAKAHHLGYCCRGSCL